jgi:NADH:ubiquinone oxidoreductase subunit D
MSELKEVKFDQPTSVSHETIDGEIATLNLGPTHPATHGIFQNILKVDGEKILLLLIANQ